MDEEPLRSQTRQDGSTAVNTFQFEPIGVVESSGKYRFEAPRQAVFADNEAVIRLQPHRNFETALRDLEGFGRIWIIFCFHLNLDKGWKPAVTPPVVKDGRKIGVFATRSPHRPNPIGMSCVELVGIDGLEVRVRNCDLLDGTPVLDIKPYIPVADSFPDSPAGWLPDRPVPLDVEFTPEAMAKITRLKEISGLDLESFARVQLSIDPLNEARKRLDEVSPDHYSIGCRTWKLFFTADLPANKITVYDLQSNYSVDDLKPGAPDPYQDKDFHRKFIEGENHG